MRRYLLWAIAALALLCVIGVMTVVWQVNQFLATPVALDNGAVDFEITPGSSFRTVSDNLADLGIIDSPELLRAYARWTGQASAVHAGRYRIVGGTTARQLLEKFTSGDVKLYSFTLIEGWNQWDLLRELRGHPQLDGRLSEEDWPRLLDDLGAQVAHPEGLFLPETYRFPAGTTDEELLRQAYSLMQSVLDEEWALRSPTTPVTSPYEALILASIVEKETGRADERARIAGVFARRLQKGMRLQTDPTVIYGIGPEFDGDLRRGDLRRDTPYNTYTRGGLPPTPIAMPGRAAIHAVLHPADGDELYFVATGLGDGSHAFSKTKAEHDAAVAQYLRRLRNQRRGEP